MLSVIHYVNGLYHSNQSVTEYDLYINCVGKIHVTKDIYKKVFRQDYYLLYVLQGKIEIADKYNDITLLSGDFIILAPYTKYIFKFLNKSSTQYLSLHFTGKYSAQILQDLSIDTNNIYSIGVRDIFLQYWNLLADEFVRKDSHFVNMCDNLLRAVLITFSRYAQNLTTTPFSKSIGYMHDSLSQKITLDDLAYLEGLSVSRYGTLFKSYMGISPIDYLIKLRIEIAIKYLKNSTYTLTDISKAIGYDDVNYFNKLFKKHTGMTPGKYRKQ